MPTGAINRLLTFLTQQWMALVWISLVVVLVYLLVKALAALRRLPVRPVEEVRNDREDERQRYQSLVADLKEDKRRLVKRVDHLTQLNAILSPLIKELNSNVDRRRMGPLVLRVVERLFEASQVLVFFTDSTAPDGVELALAACKGSSGVSEGYRQKFGDGFAGTVAQKKVIMSRFDLENESNLVRRRVFETEPKAFCTDLAAPLVYRGNVLGVVCMGGTGDLTEDQRSLFGMVADITVLAFTNYLQYRKIQELANSDQLTRLYNKTYFVETCERELTRARRDSIPMSLLMLDIDDFKHFNDTYGHLAGDRLLKELAKILKREIREKDVAGRFGGEEFVVLLTGVDQEVAAQAAERIRECIAAHEFPLKGVGATASTSVSVGVATMSVGAVASMEELIQRADDALYIAKGEGKNSVRIAGQRVLTMDH